MTVPSLSGPPLSALALGEFTTPARIGLICVLALVFNWLGRRAVSRALSTLRAGASKASAARGAESAVRAEQRLTALSSVLSSVVTFVVIVIAAFMALGELGIELGPLLAGAGIVGVAVGFGAQSLVRDFLSGIFVLIEDQFGVGDLVTVNKDVTGTVEGVSLRATRVRALDGTLWHIPNGEILQVGNQSLQWSRALVDIDVAYDTDLAQARSIITRVGRELTSEEPAILEHPEVWGVEQLGASGISLRVVTRTAPAENPRVSRLLRERIKLAFDSEGIEIPFPQATLWHREAQAV